MKKDCTVIVDIGKTYAKVSLWTTSGRLIAKTSRANDQVTAQVGGTRCRVLDTPGIFEWLVESLSSFSRHGRIRLIIPVAHGAAAVLVRSGREYLPPLDYEDPVSAAERATYSAQRDSFTTTGSPELPNGLNLGMQLHRIEQITGTLPDDVKILLWPQFWAWRLCGEMASEVSSLGCHTDLWCPIQDRFSGLATRRKWAERIPSLVPADTTMGTLLPEISTATGIPRDCGVLCGLHDSNAALLAACGHPEIANSDATILSTGTWFVAMRSLERGVKPGSIDLDETRDCLMNVDVYGNATPSARFMGGREAEVMGNLGDFDIKTGIEPEAMLGRLPQIVSGGAFAYPAFVPGVGPFPNAVCGWQRQPPDPVGQRAVASLYLALVTDVSLELIGSRDRLLVDGRYADDQVFVRALATLRPEQKVFVASAQHDLAYGALRLLEPTLPPPCEMTSVKPLNLDLVTYAKIWRKHTSRSLDTMQTKP